MGDIVTFSPNTGANIPLFIGRGSRLEHPDILPIFWGSYWAVGAGSVTTASVMSALTSMVTGPYFDGLKQYGYLGPPRLRPPQVDSTPLSITLPGLAPGVDQSAAIVSATYNYISNLLDNDAIDDVDDNHDLIVLVLLDPSIPVPSAMDSAGNVTATNGANSRIEKFEFLDDNTRFEWAWINTSRPIDQITRTISHELAEAITDPFNNGWHQSFPAPGPNGGQIGDVCEQSWGIINGVSLATYWSKDDRACIIPTPGRRRVSLPQPSVQQVPHDGPTREGYVDLGWPLCARGMFSYFERTYTSEIDIQARLEGYESPVVTWTVNGKPIPILNSTIDVAAGWEAEPPPSRLSPVPVKPSTAHIGAFNSGPTATSLKFYIGPDDGSVVLDVDVAVVESFDTASVGGHNSTLRRASRVVGVKNQEIVWGEDYRKARNNCDRLSHLSAGPGVVIGPPRPGDPPDIAEIVANAIRDHSARQGDNLVHAAALLGRNHPELAEAIQSLADRVSAQHGANAGHPQGA
jgi:hypothetical protein